MTSLTLCETGSQFDLFILAKLSKVRAITLHNFFNQPTRQKLSDFAQLERSNFQSYIFFIEKSTFL